MEMGDENEDCDTPYAHTYVFLWGFKPLDTTNAKYFDFQDIHPNIQNKRGFLWAKTIVLKYHLGHKNKNRRVVPRSSLASL